MLIYTHLYSKVQYYKVMSEGSFYTAQDLADKLQVNVMTIYRYIRSGKLKAYKLGKEYRIDSAEFTAFLESVKIK